MSNSNQTNEPTPAINNSGIPTENPLKPSNQVPPPPQMGGGEFDWVTESCVFKSTLATVMGTYDICSTLILKVLDLDLPLVDFLVLLHQRQMICTENQLVAKF